MPRLRRSDCTDAGISRRRRGRGFTYLDADGARVTDRQTLARIEALRIPPAWRDVWICLDAMGHLQATGVDAAGRKQYLYHERWRAHRDRHKYDSMLSFARALPRLRRRVAREIRDQELSRTRVLACAARLLDLGFFRIGSENYAEENDSYGLATMLREHVTVREDVVVFDYPAKSGQRRVQAIADADVLEIMRVLRRRRSGGPELLAYRQGRSWIDVRSEEINGYLKEAMGGEFSAKDFRTWNATVLAAVALASRDHPAARSSRERAISSAVKTVAGYLGNTPAVCRASYIDPRVIDLYRAGTTIAPSLNGRLSRESGPDLANRHVREQVEAAVIEMLDG